MVYADDTTLVCDNLGSVRICIEIIEKYCNIYDIAINAKKTKCMIFGKPTSIVDPTILVNGQVLEIVDTFKFLGYTLIGKENLKNILVREEALFSRA